MMMAGFIDIDQESIFGKVAQVFSHGQPVYIICYLIAIVFFAFFYTAIMFNPKETADNLKRGGSYIPGIRPGDSTADYIDTLLLRLTTIGSLYLCAICIIPEIVMAHVSLPFYLGGTSLLIVVNVSVETISQLQSHMLAQQYEGLFKRGKSKGLI